MLPDDDADGDRDLQQLSGPRRVLHRDECVICLRVVEGPLAHPDRLRAFDSRRVLGGSASIADLHLEDSALDAAHFELRRDGDHVWLEDLRSTRGTFINGDRVHAIVLAPGTVFTAGSSGILYVGLASLDVSSGDRFGGLRGCSSVMHDVFALLKRHADHEAGVVLQGEAGTGKTLAARALHERSARRAGPFVTIDCSTLNGEAGQVALLGHGDGVIADAPEGRGGCFEQAHGGTLFIDNIDELPLSLQPSLRRAIGHREVMRVGEPRWRAVDFHLVVSTARPLRHMVDKGTFLDGLYFRLPNGVIELPPLREREGDVALLAACFVEELGVPGSVLSDELLERLEAHPWPGNVRELRTIIRAGARSGKIECLHPEHLVLRSSIRVPPFEELAALPFGDASEAFERHYLVTLLRATDGDLSAAEARSGIASERFREKLRQYDLPLAMPQVRSLADSTPTEADDRVVSMWRRP